MSKGFITIPTEIGLVDKTLEVIARWGADAVRDCDGVAIPDEILKSGQKIYSTYFVSRGDNAWADAHPEEAIKIFLMSEHNTAAGDTLEIDFMKGYFDQQVKPYCNDYKKYWEVIDRTTDKLIDPSKWELDPKNNKVIVRGCKKFRVYTVNFLADLVWDSTQMYNYITNKWTKLKDKPFNAYCPESSQYVVKAMYKWLDEHPDTNVVRFTTFFFHFTLVFNDLAKEKFVDWFGYGATVSLEGLKDFQKEYGYALRAEDFVDGGYYNSTFRVPSRKYLDYIDFIQRFTARKAKELVDAVHEKGREAMMFLGDNWIGTEPYGKYFESIGMDAVVGSVGGGTTLRMIADIPHVKYTEGRFLPYFFPDTFNDKGNPVKELNDNWLCARRALMRKPLDRIGFGGYLSLALKFPDFVQRVEEVCEEFRGILDKVKGGKPFCRQKVAVLNCWGALRTWQTHMVAHALWYKQIYSYLGICEALSGMDSDVVFISFEDIKAGIPKDIDVIINAGDAGTAFSGGKNWADPAILSKIRAWIRKGGGFIGAGEPSAYESGGMYFQLSDALGVDKELGFSLSTDKYNLNETEHFITEGISAFDFGEGCKNIYAKSGAEVLKIDKLDVQIAVNSYGKGRCVYIAGLPYSASNRELLARAIAYAAGKEKDFNKWRCDNILCECSYYPEKNFAAVINNTAEKQVTGFYNGKGRKEILELGPCEIRWIKA